MSQYIGSACFVSQTKPETVLGFMLTPGSSTFDYSIFAGLFIIALLAGLCNFQFFISFRQGKEGIYRNS